MSITTSEMTPADIRACTCGNDGYGNGNGMFGDNGAWWLIVLLLFGWGRNGFGGQGGGYGAGGNVGCTYSPCATQADVRAAVDQQTLISKIDQQTYGIADTFTALNNTLNNNFRGIDNAICTLGYQGAQHANDISRQLADCCCKVEGGIKDIAYGNAMNTSAIQRQISDCCCDIEKMNMQSRFDAQAYNCNTLQAIDKLGDRIIDYMTTEKTQALRDENMALRLAASQARQNEYLIERLNPNACPVAAYVVQPPQPVSFATNCCGQTSFAGNGGCGNGCGGF